MLLAALAAAVSLGALAPTHAHAEASPHPGASGAHAPQARAALTPPWCNKTLWKSSPVAATKMLSRLSRVERVADKVDSATTIAGLLFTVVSGGTGAAPAAAGRQACGQRRQVVPEAGDQEPENAGAAHGQAQGGHRPQGQVQVGRSLSVARRLPALTPGVAVKSASAPGNLHSREQPALNAHEQISGWRSWSPLRRTLASLTVGLWITTGVVCAVGVMIENPWVLALAFPLLALEWWVSDKWTDAELAEGAFDDVAPDSPEMLELQDELAGLSEREQSTLLAEKLLDDDDVVMGLRYPSRESLVLRSAAEAVEILGLSWSWAGRFSGWSAWASSCGSPAEALRSS